VVQDDASTISTEVPPRAREVACEKAAVLDEMLAGTATAARKIEPGSVQPGEHAVEYCAVGGPGRMPRM
jgi:hypothetical protein